MVHEQRVTAILLAGGSGTRFGAEKNKVYEKIRGKMILQYSLDILQDSPHVDEVIVVIRKGEEEMAVHAKDTIKLGDDSDVAVKTTRRSHTWQVQTPQCFQRQVLWECHRSYGDRPDITDDCMLLELAGEKVKLVEGDHTNIKVTTTEDLDLAELFLRKMVQ